MVALATLFAVVALVGASAPAQAAGDTTPPAPFDIVRDVGEFQTGYSVAAPYNNIYISWQMTTDDSSSVHYEVTVDGKVERSVTDDVYVVITKRIEVPDGRHIVGVTAVDSTGNRRDATHDLEVIVDKDSPVFTTSPLLMLRTGSVTDQGYPMRFTWAGADVGTGLSAVHVGPNEECCYTIGPRRTTFDFAVEPLSSVAWRIWLYDGVGRLTRTVRDGYVSVVPNSSMTYRDGWQKRSAASAMGGSEWQTKRAGARATATLQGRSVGWVAVTGPTRGKADVLVNGKVVATVNLYSADRRPARVVWAGKLVRGRVSKVSIVSRSTDRRPLIGVDALLLQR
ncbi:MAG: hypothetical protein ABI720_04675 [Actinomycetes bacterium]